MNIDKPKEIFVFFYLFSGIVLFNCTETKTAQKNENDHFFVMYRYSESGIKLFWKIKCLLPRQYKNITNEHKTDRNYFLKVLYSISKAKFSTIICLLQKNIIFLNNFFVLLLTNKIFIFLLKRLSHFIVDFFLFDHIQSLNNPRHRPLFWNLFWILFSQSW